MCFFKKIFPAILLIGVNTGIVQAQIGFTAPNFTVVDTHGDTIRLYDILDEGKYVVLDFFYTTCGPCIYYTPQVNLAYEKYGCNTQDVVFIAIDYQDTNAEVQAYDAQYGIQYPSVSGTQGGGNGVVNQYVITGFPTFYLIDSTHKIIDEIYPPTLVVFDFRFDMHGIQPVACLTTAREPVASRSLMLYPNPTQTGFVTLDLPDLIGERVEISVQDLTGRTMFTNVVQVDTNLPYQLDLGALPGGMYLVTAVAGNDGRWIGRLVKH